MEPHWSRRTADRGRRRPRARSLRRRRRVPTSSTAIPHCAAVRRASADSSYRGSTVRTTNAWSSRAPARAACASDQPGVDAPTQHDAHRDIAPEAEPNGVGEPGVDLVEQRLAGGRDRLGPLGRSSPGAHGRRASIAIDVEPGSHRYRRHVPIDGPWTRDHAQRQVVVEGDLVDRVVPTDDLAQRRQLRRERNAASRRARPVERLLAQPVSGEHEPSRSTVPEREREHASQSTEEPVGVVLVEVRDDGGVGGGRDGVPRPRARRATRCGCRSRRCRRRLECPPRRRLVGRRPPARRWRGGTCRGRSRRPRASPCRRGPDAASGRAPRGHRRRAGPRPVRRTRRCHTSSYPPAFRFRSRDVGGAVRHSTCPRSPTSRGDRLPTEAPSSHDDLTPALGGAGRRRRGRRCLWAQRPFPDVAQRPDADSRGVAAAGAAAGPPLRAAWAMARRRRPRARDWCPAPRELSRDNARLPLRRRHLRGLWSYGWLWQGRVLRDAAYDGRAGRRRAGLRLLRQTRRRTYDGPTSVGPSSRSRREACSGCASAPSRSGRCSQRCGVPRPLPGWCRPKAPRGPTSRHSRCQTSGDRPCAATGGIRTPPPATRSTSPISASSSRCWPASRWSCVCRASCRSCVGRSWRSRGSR